MKTVRERAKEITEKWFENQRGSESLLVVEHLIELVETSLKEQDKLTRHAIAGALFDGSSPIKIKGEGLVDVIEMTRAESIAMNTSAL